MRLDLTRIHELYPDASFDDTTGIYTLPVREGLVACVRGMVDWKALGEELRLENTTWEVNFKFKYYNILLDIDLEEYDQPYWWADAQLDPSGLGYTQDDCFKVADFILAIWTYIYDLGCYKYGHIIATWLVGLNVVR